MAEPTKDELAQTASDIGVPNAEDMKKAELAEAIEARTPDALGPVIPAGEVTAPAPESGGRSLTGIQTVNAEDIPEEAR